MLDKKELLVSLGVLKERDVTNAGILFFVKEPQKFFPQSVYTAIVYKDKEGTIVLKREEIKGSLFKIVNKVMELVRFYTNVAYKFTGKPQREEIYEYPLEAVREAVINSLMHKYYLEPGHNNIIAIFPNRIEIENYWIKPRDFVLGETKFRRNPIISDLFFRINYGEKIGSGIKRMKKICKEGHAPLPKFDIQERYFYVTFMPSAEYVKIASEEVPQKWSEKWSDLTERQIKILGLIKEKPSISRKELSEKIGINQSATQKHLEKLKQKGIIRRIGPDKGGYWEIKK